MSKKILIISQNFYPELGSAANRIKILYSQLKKHKYEPYVLTTEPSYPNKELFKDKNYYDDSLLNQDEGEHILRLKMSLSKQHKSMIVRFLYYIEQMFRVRKFIDKNKDQFDFIYVTSPNIFLPWATLFFKGKSKRKYILEIRDLWPDSVASLKQFKFNKIMPILKYLEKKMYRNANKIVVNNESFKKEIYKSVSKDKAIFNLPNALTIKEQIHKTKLKQFKVIYTGNIGYAQDVNYLIEIAKELNARKIHMTAIVYGVQAPLFREAVIKNNLSYIHLVPPMKRDACLNEISQHHLALSILEENEVFYNVLPGKIVDAIGVGTPVVTNLDGYTKHLIETYETGYANSNYKVDDIIKIISHLKSNREQLDRLTNNTENLTKDFFTWENNIKALIDFIEE
ncbi:glycosyltransferase family 4 protein [Staphylococcus massiliensis]|uniref:glycosyltransferase family 4 protein n=1 Tax=Staphylococcus massiliensis TaxID=555791 RepID=UPI001EE001FF|nr:glycosyltransferase family 4 protein [Staphylococcus massiliensis]MCG3413386.1 glycosyltransferase family 4 protein [Staphylococcus massiliensis]